MCTTPRAQLKRPGEAVVMVSVSSSDILIFFITLYIIKFDRSQDKCFKISKLLKNILLTQGQTFPHTDLKKVAFG